MSLEKFLAKHAVELGTIANVLSEIVNLLPLGSQDKRNLGNKIGTVAQAAVNIAESVAPLVKDAKTAVKDAKAALPAVKGVVKTIKVKKSGGPKA